jgi:hypothetical protein
VAGAKATASKLFAINTLQSIYYTVHAVRNIHYRLFISNPDKTAVMKLFFIEHDFGVVALG